MSPPGFAGGGRRRQGPRTERLQLQCPAKRMSTA